MIAQLELETYRHLVSYLSGATSLRDFRLWFDAETWDCAADSDLIAQIELALAELSSGHRTESEFKQILHSFTNLTLQIEPLQVTVAPFVTSGADNKLKQVQVAVATSTSPDSHVGRLREVEFA